jgi:hypothetical protein
MLVDVVAKLGLFDLLQVEAWRSQAPSATPI